MRAWPFGIGLGWVAALALAVSVLALLCDQILEGPLFALGGVISGHGLKHLIAEFAGYWLLRGLRQRRAG